MLRLVQQADGLELYEYYNNYLVGTTPYDHQVSRISWDRSFFEDTDYDGDKKYKELETYCSLAADGTINGFIQWGLSNYGYDEDGEKNVERSTGIIRQFHFLKNQKAVGKELLETAIMSFQEKGVKMSYAFFHALGMTCTGNHGKLHESMTEAAELLFENGFSVEHTNVYYVKNLKSLVEHEECSLAIKQAEKTENQTQMLTFYEEGQAVGQANIAFLPENPIAYLRWIFMLDDHQNKGFGTQALQLIFAFLSQEGIIELHTDTADTNKRAQHVYEKNGFEHSGITRSYMVI
ncbi:GNAT family N-acetyltransferase [Enterococcus larvae]|uniref:GNAT family N-acetyltransferase n=1 Tax=Enterococcus larvae TaxID=2794352 RepID=UPI003F2CFA66